jgi:hypothetical protein
MANSEPAAELSPSGRPLALRPRLTAGLPLSTPIGPISIPRLGSFSALGNFCYGSGRRAHREDSLRLGEGEGHTGVVEGRLPPAPDVASAGQVRAPSADQKWRSDERDRMADERERVADERDRRADQRERRADERERLADEREERRHGEGGHGPRAALQRSHEALGRMREALDRAGQRVDRLEGDTDRDEAESKREQAEVDREMETSQRESDEAQQPR